MTSMPSSARSLDSDRGLSRGHARPAISRACGSRLCRECCSHPSRGGRGSVDACVVAPAVALAFDDPPGRGRVDLDLGERHAGSRCTYRELPDAGGAPDESGDASPEPTVPVAGRLSAGRKRRRRRRRRIRDARAPETPAPAPVSTPAPASTQAPVSATGDTAREVPALVGPAPHASVQATPLATAAPVSPEAATGEPPATPASGAPRASEQSTPRAAQRHHRVKAFGGKRPRHEAPGRRRARTGRRAGDDARSSRGARAAESRSRTCEGHRRRDDRCGGTEPAGPARGADARGRARRVAVVDRLRPAREETPRARRSAGGRAAVACEPRPHRDRDRTWCSLGRRLALV